MLVIFLWIGDLRRDDLPIEGKGCLVEIGQRYRRAEIASDVETVVGGESHRRSDRYSALRHDLTVDLQRDVQ